MRAGNSDLIFKELIKRGYKREGTSRVWSLADSKLWYLTPKQAQKFLDLETDDNYRTSVTDKEIPLIKEHLPDIIASLDDDYYNLVDLGCGNGKKAALLIEDMSRKLDLRYCPIDISAYMVKKAAETLKKISDNEVIQFQWNVSDFENLNNIMPLLRDEPYENNLLLLLGNTLGNFDIDDILHSMQASMQVGDTLLIGNGISGPKKPEEWVEAYRNDIFQRWLMETFKLMGFDEDDIECDVRFVDSHIEEFGRLKRDKQINYLWHTLEFRKGDIITVIVSYKYTLDQFQKALQKFFPQSEVYTDKEKTYAIAACHR